MICACRMCGNLFECTTEEAYTPIWCCSWSDRICLDCYTKIINKRLGHPPGKGDREFMNALERQGK